MMIKNVSLTSLALLAALILSTPTAHAEEKAVTEEVTAQTEPVPEEIPNDVMTAETTENSAKTTLSARVPTDENTVAATDDSDSAEEKSGDETTAQDTSPKGDLPLLKFEEVEVPGEDTSTAVIVNQATPINHAAYSAWLLKYAMPNPDGLGITRLSYATVTPEDVTALGAYIDDLAKIHISEYPQTEQLAFWVNLYNAAVIKNVLQHYPVASPDEVKDFYTSTVTTVEEEELSLTDIRDKARAFNYPLVHYVLADGTLGGVDVPLEALSATNLDQLMVRGAYYFVSHPRSAYFDKDGKFYLSAIYRDYQADFGGDLDAILAHLKKYADDALKEQLDQVTSVEGYFSDRSLNDTESSQSKKGRSSLWQSFLKMINGNM